MGSRDSHGLVFIRALRSCLAGDQSDRPEVCRIAKAIWRARCSFTYGPKLTPMLPPRMSIFLSLQSIFGRATALRLHGRRTADFLPTD